MTQSKKVCCEECKDGTYAGGPCPNRNCPCSQSESIECELMVQKIVEEGFKKGHIAIPSGSKWLYEVLSQAITTAVAKRELELVEELKGKKWYPSGWSFGKFRQGYNSAIEDVLSLLKH